MRFNVITDIPVYFSLLYRRVDKIYINFVVSSLPLHRFLIENSLSCDIINNSNLYDRFLKHKVKWIYNFYFLLAMMNLKLQQCKWKIKNISIERYTLFNEIIYLLYLLFCFALDYIFPFFFFKQH